MTLASWPSSTGAGLDFAYKQTPEDFRVTELSHPQLDGRPLHRYLWIQKRDRTTIDLVRQLAQAASQPESSIGYAGMKDRQAVTRQWLSVPEPAFAAVQAELNQDDSLQLLASAQHGRKLRRGELQGNRFEVLLYDAQQISDALLERVARMGAPNYFGVQRFGRDQQNLANAQRWLEKRRTARGRERQIKAFTRGLHLSVLRSYLFNEVLAARVRHGSWNRKLEGDLCLGPEATGPLWGRGRSKTEGAAGVLEAQALAPHLAIAEGLEFAGVQQARRPLALRPQRLRWHRRQAALCLKFDLPKGAYATSLLAELGRPALAGQLELAG